MLVISVHLAQFAQAQTVLARDSFETTTSSPSAGFSISGGAYKTGTSGTGDRPASSNFFLDGARAYSVNNGTATLTSATLNTTTYSSISLTFRVASWSVNSSGNGADASDSVWVEVSPDGGSNYYKQLTIKGNSNAYWGYSASGNATKTYVGSANNHTLYTSGTGNQTAAGYSTVTVSSLPSVSNLKVKIGMKNDNANEVFTIDSFVLVGTLSLSPAVSVSTLNEFTTSAVSTPSAEQTVIVSGSNLSNNISITPPTGFEISTGTGGSFVATNPITLTQSGGTVNNTNIYIRYNPASLSEQYISNGNTLSVTSTGANTQTVDAYGTIRNLNQGDIALIGFNTSTTDAISFIALTSIPANTIIKFTDNGYSDATTQMTGEGTLIYTAPSALSAGTVVSWNNGMNISGTGWNSSAPSNFSLNTTGEQLFVYQGTWGVSGGTTSLHQGFMTGGTWTASGTVASTNANSYLPTGLTTGTSAADFSLANAYYTNNSTNTVNSKTQIFNKSSTAANWTTSATSMSTPSWTFNIIAEEPTTQPTFSAATSIGNNSMTLNFSGGNGTGYIVVMKQGSAITGSPSDGTSYTANTVFATGSTISTGEYVVYNGSTSGTSVSVTGLSAGTTYHFAIFSYNGTGTTSNFYVTSPGTGNDVTTGSSNSFASNIIVNAVFTEPSNINYASYQENTNLTTGTSIEVAKFTIQDGGGSADADAQTTTLTSVTFSITGNTLLQRLALYDGSTELAEAAVSGSTITFSGLTLSAADDASKDFSIRASFVSSVTDNSQFSFTITNTNADVAGSGFTSANAGGAVSSTTGDRNKIEVNTTTLVFDVNVTNVQATLAMSPSPVIKAKDGLANLDLDNTSNITMSVTTGSAVFSGSATITVSMSAGVATFSNLVFTSAATTNKITGTQGSITVESSSFDVSSGPTTLDFGDIAVIGYNTNASPDNFAILILKDLNAGTTFYVNDNEVSSAGGTSFTDLSEVEASFTVKSGQTISAGTVIVLPWGSSAVSAATYDWTSTSGAGFGNNNDEIYIYTANAITDQTPSKFIYFTKIGSSPSSVPSGLVSTFTSVAPSGSIMRYAISGSVYSGCKTTILATVSNTSNWSTATSLAANDWTFSSVTNNSTNSWNVSSGNWNTAGNWTCAAIPNAFETIILSSGTLTMDVDVTIATNNTFTISGTGILEIAAAKTLTIAGTANFGGRPVYLRSASSGTANIGTITGTLSNATAVTVERFIPGTAGRKYRYLAAPFSSGPTIASSWQQSIYITGAGSGGSACPSLSAHSNGFDASTNNSPSMYTFNESTAVPTASTPNVSGATVYTNAWTSVSTTNATSLTAGTGYNVFIRGNRSQGCNLLNGTNPTPADVTLSASGTIYTGTFPFSISYNAANGDGWNLIGNPYPSAINWDDASWTKTNVSNTIWTFDPANDRFATYITGTGGTNGGSNIIASGQAFFIKANNTSPVLSITETAKSTSTPASFFKSKQFKISILLTNSQNKSDEHLIVLSNNESDLFNENNDALKMSNGSGVNIYSLDSNDIKYAINTIGNPADNAEKHLKLGIGTAAQGTYQFNIALSGVPSFYQVFLADHYLNTENMLNVTDSNHISFAVNADSASFGNRRFELIIANNRPHSTGISVVEDSNNKISIYPNPAETTISLNALNPVSGTYEIIDINGRIQAKGIVNNANELIPIDFLASGFYLIRFFQDNNMPVISSFIKK